MQRPRGPRALALLVAAATLLAGCTGSGSDAGDDPESLDPNATPGATPGQAGNGAAGGVGNVAGGSGAGNATGDASVARFGEGLPLETPLTFTGSFAMTDATFPFGVVGVATGNRNVHLHDLVPHVPVGVPTLIRADLSAPDVDTGNINMGFTATPGTIVRSQGGSSGGGTEWDEALVVRTSSDATLSILVEYATTDDQDVDYTIEALVRNLPELIPTGRPIAVDVGPGATALAFEAIPEPETADEDDGNGGGGGGGDSGLDVSSAMVWDPMDVFLGRISLTSGDMRIALGPEAPVGEYVVLLPNSADDLRLRVEGAMPLGVRVLTTEAVTAAPQDASSGSAGWNFELPQAAVQVGFLVQSATAMMDFEGAILAPNGEPLALVSAVFPRAGVMSDFSPVAASAIEPGSYEGRFSAQVAQGVQVSEVVVVYLRDAAEATA